jgi:hypothetical protein
MPSVLKNTKLNNFDSFKIQKYSKRNFLKAMEKHFWINFLNNIVEAIKIVTALKF